MISKIYPEPYPVSFWDVLGFVLPMTVTILADHFYHYPQAGLWAIGIVFVLYLIVWAASKTRAEWTQTTSKTDPYTGLPEDRYDHGVS